MCDLIPRALRLHQTGEFVSAARLYEDALARDATDADALHLLGVLCHQQGNHSRAVELIGKAVTIRPNAPAFHANLAEAYRSLGKLGRAAGCALTAIQLWPDYPEAHNNLGLVLKEQGRRGEAIEHFRHALELRSDYATAHNNLGIALKELGQGDEALIHFFRTVELAPDFAAGRTNLGQLLLEHGRAEEALLHCQEAARLQPDIGVLHHNLGNAFRALNRLAEARAAYLEALRIEPNLALAQAHLGLVLQREGRLADALPWMKRAVELAPDDATCWEYLADLYDDRDEPAESIPCWERIVALTSGDRPGPYLALGWALQERGRHSESGDCYRNAIERHPKSASAWVSLGGHYEEEGAMTEAEAAYRKALALQPSHALAHARLAQLLRGRLSEADVAALESRLCDTELPPRPRARLLFGLAQVLDAHGEFGKAATRARGANALALGEIPDWKRYAPDAHERYVDHLIRVFSLDFFVRTKRLGHDSRRPVFVFGFPRSGTTLIEQILASHSRVHGAGELILVRRLVEEIPSTCGRSERPFDRIVSLEGPPIRSLALTYLNEIEALAPPQADRIVDKMPDNYLYIGLLAALFPEGTFVHCSRDLRDVAVSCWFADFRNIRWAHDPAQVASRLFQYQRLMDHWRAVLPVPLHEVKYEDTVADLASTAKRLVSACGLDWEPNCLDFHRTKRVVRTASVAQVRQPLYDRSVGRWKNYQHDLTELLETVASVMHPHSEELNDQ